MTGIGQHKDQAAAIERRIAELLGRMTLEEKIGQMSQVNAGEPGAPEYLGDALRAGQIGAVINLVDPAVANELQRIAAEESRLGIPLLVGRDVIHGFTTIAPIPLGLAATWDTELVRETAAVAAAEAAAAGINWTFAPMIDVARDPRWGRIAESFGEDPCLTARLGVAAIEGFQGDDLAAPGRIAACAKHFAGYGAVEGGRDYDATSIPENELRNVHMTPFRAAVDAGVATLMTSFSDLNGVPATANEFLLRDVLRDEWGYTGLVVSDWESIPQLSVHGVAADDRECAAQAATAGIDLEMASSTFRDHLPALVAEGRVSGEAIDAAVAHILRTKFRLGLFDDPYVDPGRLPSRPQDARLRVMKEAALKSAVLLKNDGHVLPLAPERPGTIAVIGPLADAAYEQLGTWVFDGDPGLSVTPLEGIRKLADGTTEVRYAPGMATSRTRSEEGFDEAVAAARAADAVILVLGEESILSGEAHCRADIGLPGAQPALVRRIRQLGKPVVAVILAGRPLTLTDVIDDLDGVLFAWHPGTMGGEAIAELLFGVESPSGKLPATFPRMVGQVPIYYGHKNTGKPPSPETVVHIDEIAPGAPQTSLGMTAFHLDAGYRPLFPFGHGLTYTQFRYAGLVLSRNELSVGESIDVSVEVANIGHREAEDVVQLYVRDLIGSVTRPVRELKAFRRVRLGPGESATVGFALHTDALAFYDRHNRLVVEPGEFHLWVGGSSEAGLRADFRVIGAD